MASKAETVATPPARASPRRARTNILRKITPQKRDNITSWASPQPAETAGLLAKVVVTYYKEYVDYVTAPVAAMPHLPANVENASCVIDNA